ncbi:MAG: DUF1294 domain-containing protein [Clostridia bacterium]|nr:DUF1294 domain-containing protein [Clostridia bacterium]
MENILLLLGAVGSFLKAHALVVLIILGVINLIAFVMYGLDKRYAKNGQWRIPEANLITVAALYGALGAFLAMQLFRHKTKHLKFTITVPLLLILQIAFAIVVMVV